MGIPKLLLCALFIISCFSCKKSGSVTAKDDGGSYFSIKAYGADQYRIYHGQPFGIIKTVTLNGKTESIPTNVEKVNWGDVFKVFFDADISDKKFDGQYSFTEFGDSMTMTDSHIYEAKDKKLFTQKFIITTGGYSHKITSVYIETAKNSSSGDHIQKLFYEPAKSIIIQEFESSLVGEDKNLKVEYRFL